MKIPVALEKPHLSLTTCFLHVEDTHDDIYAYVHSVVQNALPDDPGFQRDISSRFLARASGSFLWVRLALDTLQDNWHTKEDIYKVLTEVPKGMVPLYKQMLETIETQSPRLRLMAKRILTWAICCWRPLTVTELQIALQPEFQNFVRLEDTIVQICGHFIFVDNSKICLVHATARNFLLHSADNDSPFIDPREEHEHLAVVLMRYLSHDYWRLVFRKIEISSAMNEPHSTTDRLLLAEKSHPLLEYATCHWAYHVSKSSAGAHILISVLKSFLTKYALSWIEGIALSGNLRYLTRSGQYLKAFSKKRARGSKLDILDNLSGVCVQPEDGINVQLWANDFIHIVGRFGRNLVQRPSTIHRIIPALCPQLSVTHLTHSVTDEKSLSIAELTSEGWDDCLACVTVGDDEIASKVLATNAYFLTLISTTGNIVVWHSETCEEARKICHGEYVSLMVLNPLGTLLATVGLTTYRIWDVSSGKELYCLPKQAEGLTMTIAFGSTDTQLLIGLNDCSINRYDLETSLTLSVWKTQDSLQELHGCPKLVVISPDLRKVAIARRGKPLMIWHLDDSSLPSQQCRVSGTSDPLNAPELVRWQTDGDSVLILCLSSQIVEWNLYNEEQTEYGKNHDMAAREMAVSADGKFLLTSDNVGTMSVWTFPRLQLIYRLLNRNEFIRDLTFSPNGQRFYDTRESMCNVWEPDALVCTDDADLEDASSIAESYAATEAVILRDESSQNQVTALAIGPDGQFYCCGKEDGSVAIHESIGGKRNRKVCNYTATSSVISLAWSRSGRYLVSSDDSGRVISKRLQLKEDEKWAVFPGMDVRINETVKQFIFSNDERLLLISTSSKELVWDLKAKREIYSKHHQEKKNGRWMADHKNSDMLLWIEHGKASSHAWTTLKSSESHTYSISGMLAEESGAYIRGVFLSSDKRSLIYETIHAKSAGGPKISILSTSCLSFSWEVELSGQVKRLIGMFQNSVVFLDHDYWVCTWELGERPSDVKKHFFLPKDWLNSSTLQMATVDEFGTLFCPKFGNVIIARNGVKT